MSAGRLVLHAMIVLVACVVGFAMGRWSHLAEVRSGISGDGGFAASGPDRDRVWERDTAGSLGGSLPVTGDAFVNDFNASRSLSDDGPSRQFFPEAVDPRSLSRVPGRFPATELAQPVQDAGPTASRDQVRDLVEKELPAASQADKQVWIEELEGLPLESVREILLLKKSLGPLGSPANPGSSDTTSNSTTDGQDT